MQLLFLGTGAADWKIGQPCDNGEYRRYSSALINGELLIDPNPCVPEALKTFGKDISAIRYIINTHRHSDHYCEETVDLLRNAGAQFVDLSAGQEKNIGGYNIRAYTANHGTCENAVHFIIGDGEKSIFYALDGAWLNFDEISAIRKTYINIAVLDATIGDVSGDYRIFEHNNLKMVEEMKASLTPYIDRFIISHMARTLHTDHKTLVCRMQESGIEVAFDGFETGV